MTLNEVLSHYLSLIPPFQSTARGLFRDFKNLVRHYFHHSEGLCPTWVVSEISDMPTFIVLSRHLLTNESLVSSKQLAFPDLAIFQVTRILQSQIEDLHL